MVRLLLLVMVDGDNAIRSEMVRLPSLVIVEDSNVKFPIENNVFVMVKVLEFNVRLLSPIVRLALSNEIVDDVTGYNVVMLKVALDMDRVLESSERLPSLIVRLALSTKKRVADELIGRKVVVVIFVLLMFSLA